MGKKCLIVEGGGFKTGFTAGILDAFIMSNYKPFNQYIGISGGCTALSYYLSEQYRFCISAIKLLAQDESFTDFKRTFGQKGYMDIDFIANVAQEKVPLNLEKAISGLRDASLHFVATNRETGNAEYLEPTLVNWIDTVIASSTLPFVTKGKHFVNGIEYFDGGWSDAIPVKWAYEQGASEILILRTWPEGTRSTQSWSDYFGSVYFSSSPTLKKVFEESYKKYNESVDFIESHPSEVVIEQITPTKLLKSSTYGYSKNTIMNDYRYGVDKGLNFVHNKKAAV